MARKPSVNKNIEKISRICTKELSELQKMLEKPDVDDILFPLCKSIT